MSITGSIRLTINSLIRLRTTAAVTVVQPSARTLLRVSIIPPRDFAGKRLAAVLAWRFEIWLDPRRRNNTLQPLRISDTDYCVVVSEVVCLARRAKLEHLVNRTDKLRSVI